MYGEYSEVSKAAMSCPNPAGAGASWQQPFGIAELVVHRMYGKRGTNAEVDWIEGRLQL